ncbi:ABC transporter substrate-binding protein [Pelagibacterium xiamenense]|uniref:ABC transporter substrate-binding protein n=1 Tax=Pelagibacterium xiamenense TaxID=2901140 RepID=UPI001E3513E4|nr:ABC transporter substrate-binding protein [Pelagibacterium xiamenense]MCD7060718.1 ABC transporter substrate-binding protein [Pelagibacterium xiamenense]
MSFGNQFRTTRRNVLLGGAAAFGATLLPRTLFAQTSTPITTAFGWISNVEYGGFWAGLEQGYFAQEGIDAGYLPGGPNAPDTLVSLSADRAQMCTANWLPILDAIEQGNDFVVLGAQWQRSPAALMSMTSNPVRTPEDLVGKRILAQNPSDSVIIDSVLGNAGLPLDYEIIPTGFSPEPLIAGDGDVYFCFATNQPITMEQLGYTEGEDFVVTLFDDLGYVVKQGIVVTKRSFLEDNRAAVVGYLKALVKGWQYAIDNPDYAPQIVIDNYGADLGLDLAQQQAQMARQIPLLTPEEGGELFMFDPQVIGGTMTEAAIAAGRTVPPIEDLVDLTPLQEALATI